MEPCTSRPLELARTGIGRSRHRVGGAVLPSLVPMRELRTLLVLATSSRSIVSSRQHHGWRTQVNHRLRRGKQFNEGGADVLWWINLDHWIERSLRYWRPCQDARLQVLEWE